MKAIEEGAISSPERLIQDLTTHLIVSYMVIVVLFLSLFACLVINHSYRQTNKHLKQENNRIADYMQGRVQSSKIID